MGWPRERACRCPRRAAKSASRPRCSWHTQVSRDRSLASHQRDCPGAAASRLERSRRRAGCFGDRTGAPRPSGARRPVGAGAVRYRSCPCLRSSHRVPRSSGSSRPALRARRNDAIRRLPRRQHSASSAKRISYDVKGARWVSMRRMLNLTASRVRRPLQNGGVRARSIRGGRLRPVRSMIKECFPASFFEIRDKLAPAVADRCRRVPVPQ
jgi:hypothetical protein